MRSFYGERAERRRRYYMLNTSLLQVKNLVKHFDTNAGAVHAVDDVTLSVGRGETLGVVGESGCGKSTLGRAILRLVEPTSGEVWFEGKDILRFGKDEMKSMRKDMQMIFQDPYASLDPRMTLSTIIAEPLRSNNVCRSKNELNARVLEIMKTVGLSERLVNTYPHELDGGRRQRIGIARALAMRPKFIVCDEPVSALDVSIQAQILNLMMDIQQNMGLSYIFITHSLSVVKHISNDILVMYLGKVVEKARSEELFDNPLHPYTRALLAAIPVPDASSRNKKRQIIKGEVSSPINPKPGCRFAPRCTLAKPECFHANPTLEKISDGHFVACYLIR